MRLAFLGLLTLALVLAGLPGASESQRLSLVQWSDIHAGGRHFEPAVWAQALREGLQMRPDLLLVTGDQGDNSHDRAGFDERLRQFMATLGTDLAQAPPVLITLGNDDLADNYQSDPPLLRETLKTFRATLGARCYLDDLGNGRYPGRPGGMRWLSLNSVVFSPFNRGPEAPGQAARTLDWLERELGSTTGPVVLLCHIPPAWDLYTRQPAWRREYLSRLREILLACSDPVAILCGHFHRNHVQGYRRPQGDVPVLIAGSLSNKFGYAPNWRSFECTLGPAGFERLDYTVRYPGHPEWAREWRIEPNRLEEFRSRLVGDDGAYLDYMRDVYGHHRDLEQMAASARPAVLEEFWVQP